MKISITMKLALHILLTILFFGYLQGQTTLIEQGSDWKYLDDGSNQDTEWKNIDFNDSEWATGTAELGYGDGDETTVISYGPDYNNKYITYYFRKEFTANLNDITPIILIELLRDDGAVVYLNGQEITRSNMPEGTINYLTLASSTVSGDAEDTFNEYFVPSYLIQEGTNTLAVEIHQRSLTSSDVSFDLGLYFTNDGPPLIRKEPYLIFTGSQSEMQLLWQLNATETCNIEWGTDLTYGLGNETTNEYGNDHQHGFIFTELETETVYYYKMTVSENVITGKFKSYPDETKETLTFFAYGDTRSQPNYHDDVAEQIVAEIENDDEALSFIVSSGDFVNNGDLEEDWDNQFFDNEYPFIREMMQQLPYLGAVGNHEGNGTLFSKYFPYPFYTGGDYYWSFDYGPAHFTIIDQFSSYTVGSTQYNWIVNDLATSTKPWKFILLHKPGWSAGGGHSNSTTVQNVIQPLCMEYGVQFIISGHNHYYACAVVDDVVHITTGGGGAPLYNPDPSYPNIVKTSKTYHFCKLVMDEYSLNFTAINSNGTIIHEFDYHTIIVGLPETGISAQDLVIAPNPSNKTTNINFVLKEKDYVNISIYNTAGKIVTVLTNKELSKGKHNINWDGTNNNNQKVVAGVYYFRIETGSGQNATKKLIRLNY